MYWGFGRGMESVDRFIPIPILVRIWHFTVYIVEIYIVCPSTYPSMPIYLP